VWTLTWKGLLAAKARFVLTGLAVIIGTGFVAGALTFGDTLERGFDDLFTSIVGSADVIVRAEAPDEDGPAMGPGAGTEVASFPTDVVDRLAGLDEVELAEGEVEGIAVLVGDDGEPIGQFGPPTLGYSAFDNHELDAAELRSGAWPQDPGQIAIDAGTAGSQGWEVGAEVQLVLDGPVEPAEVVGIFGLGDMDNLMGATIVVVDKDTALARFGTDGEYTAAYLTASAGTSEAELIEAVSGALGDGYTVMTAAEVAEEQQAAIAPFVEVFSIALLVFALVALLVGSFLIFNTFTIVLASRLRELALLRAIGAGRRQLLGSVLAEAALIGALGGAIGAAVGLLVAEGLGLILGTIGVSLPGEGLVVLPRTVLVAVVVGIVVTTLAAVVPALRAVRIPPVAALTEVAVAAPVGRGIVRTVVGTILLVAGLAALAMALVGDAGVAVLGVGAVALFVAVASLAPLIVRPLAHVLGAPGAAAGVSGELARANAMRNPRRTAATASALMIGLALVSFVSIFASSLQATFRDTIADSFDADAVLQAGTVAGVPDAVMDELRAIAEVEVVAPAAAGNVELDGERSLVGVMSADDFLAVFDFEVTAGDLETFRDGGIVVTSTAADDRGLTAGDRVTAGLPAGEVELPVVAVIDGGGIDVSWFVDAATWTEGGGRTATVYSAYVTFVPDVEVADASAAAAEVAGAYPQVRLLDQAGFADALGDQLDQLVGVVVALLALSVIVALLGIVNTLVLSVVERTREIGLLRAVGMTRPQVRRMVRAEAISVALIGAALGLLLGIPLGAAFTQVDQLNLTTFSLPWTQIVAGVVLAAVAGLLAGVVPARRAARLDVLEALHTE
jgi:putative ABC transport system permease protein